MSEICKNWTQWLKQNRFAGQTPEMIEQTTKWLEAVRDVILVYAEIQPYDVVIDIGTGTGLLAFKALEMQEEIVYNIREYCVLTARRFISFQKRRFLPCSKKSLHSFCVY